MKTTTAQTPKMPERFSRKYNRLVTRDAPVEIEVHGLHPEDEAVAEEFLRRWNAHAALVEAVERARQDINWMLNNRKFLDPDTFEYLDDALKAEADHAD